MIPSRFPTELRTVVLAPFIALITVGLAACGAAEEAVTERIVEEASGGDVDIELDGDGQIALIETEDGSLQAVVGGDVPEEWPADVPLFEGGVLGSSQVATSNGETIVMLTYTTDADPEESFGSLVEAYESAGFTAASEATMGDGTGGFSTYVGQRDGVTVSLGVTWGQDASTGLSLSVGYPAG
jgi:hypothetical protein